MYAHPESHVEITQHILCVERVPPGGIWTGRKDAKYPLEALQSRGATALGCAKNCIGRIRASQSTTQYLSAATDVVTREKIVGGAAA